MPQKDSELDITAEYWRLSRCDTPIVQKNEIVNFRPNRKKFVEHMPTDTTQINVKQTLDTVIAHYIKWGADLEQEARNLDALVKENPQDYSSSNIARRNREVANEIWIRVERLQKIAKHL